MGIGKERNGEYEIWSSREKILVFIDWVGGRW